MSIISLSLPKDLLEKLDSIRGDDRGASRSEIIRQVVRLYVSEYCQLDEIIGKVITAVTVLYETTEKNDELFHLQT